VAATRRTATIGPTTAHDRARRPIRRRDGAELAEGEIRLTAPVPASRQHRHDRERLEGQDPLSEQASQLGIGVSRCDIAEQTGQMARVLALLEMDSPHVAATTPLLLGPPLRVWIFQQVGSTFGGTPTDKVRCLYPRDVPPGIWQLRGYVSRDVTLATSAVF